MKHAKKVGPKFLRVYIVLNWQMDESCPKKRAAESRKLVILRFSRNTSLDMVTRMEFTPKKLDPASVEKKLKLTADLFDFAMTVKRYQISKQFPKLSENAVTRKAYELLERGCR